MDYRNWFWPAKYLIDAQGAVRYFTLGEGRYAQTENLVRDLPKQADPTVQLPPTTGQDNDKLTADRAPEAYLRTSRIRGYTGTLELTKDKATTYAFPPAAQLELLPELAE
ncbi:hypothetical protein CF54_14875 [Streptomyces sp. Tu 6176]|uniref:hypothetical protein n=1 Tax=Streptomyces sp. Tu 6176 TaxID=1470557 RepID=UPI00045067A8|nr:hypothetical protein [Streptomyces sp. Tu 6176]EYT82201.1 hypothetical protein CF54_14875 [Streptomyces sp. Tu 6176]